MIGNTIVLYDDSAPVRPHARQMAGLTRYGDLLFRGVAAADVFRSAAIEAGWGHFVRVTDPRALDAERERIATGRGGAFYLYMPSALAWSGDAVELVAFLRNLLTARLDVASRVGGEMIACGDTTLAARLLTALKAGQQAEMLAALPAIRPPHHLVDLTVEAAFVTHFASAFAVRHFNTIDGDAFVLRKASTDRAKLRREYDYYHLIPAHLRMYFVNAFDFRDDGTTASYAMERLFVPDTAIQWVHGSFDEQDFQRLVSRLFHYLVARRLRSPVGVNYDGR